MRNETPRHAENVRTISARCPAEIGSAANSYEILAKLATGGMAGIFLARGASAAGVERYVVLKRVHRHRASDVHFVQMFLDEARLAAQLQHPNIARVYDIGKLGDSYFFTMEYVHGETVRTLLTRSHGLRAPIPVGAVLSIVAGAAAGLHHHRDAVRHGERQDLVPVARAVQGRRDRSPQRSVLARHRDVGDAREREAVPSPRRLRDDEGDRRRRRAAAVAAALRGRARDRVVMRLLAKDPAERFQTGEELHATSS